MSGSHREVRDIVKTVVCSKVHFINSCSIFRLVVLPFTEETIDDISLATRLIVPLLFLSLFPSPTPPLLRGDISHQNNIHIYLFLVCLFWNMVLWLWCRSTYGSKDMPEVQFHLWKTSKEGFGNTEGEENQHYTTASSHGKLCMLVYHFSAKHF